MKGPSSHANEAAVNPNQRGRLVRINPTSPRVLRRQLTMVPTPPQAHR